MKKPQATPPLYRVLKEQKTSKESARYSWQKDDGSSAGWSRINIAYLEYLRDRDDKLKPVQKELLEAMQRRRDELQAKRETSEGKQRREPGYFSRWEQIELNQLTAPLKLRKNDQPWKQNSKGQLVEDRAGMLWSASLCELAFKNKNILTGTARKHEAIPNSYCSGFLTLYLEALADADQRPDIEFKPTKRSGYRVPTYKTDTDTKRTQYQLRASKRLVEFGIRLENSKDGMARIISKALLIEHFYAVLFPYIWNGSATDSLQLSDWTGRGSDFLEYLVATVPRLKLKPFS